MHCRLLRTFAGVPATRLRIAIRGRRKMSNAFVSAPLGVYSFRPCARENICEAREPTRRANRFASVPRMSAEPEPSSQSVSSEDPNEKARQEKLKEIERLRAAEKFIVINEGKFECPGCGYIYAPDKGEFMNSVKAGTAFDDLPENFSCPSCKTPKSRFFPVKKTIAGFAENQQYGFGTNSLTAGQKNGLIFGGLFVFFLLLLSGYALN